VVLRHLYTAEVPAWEEAEGTGNDVGCKASERGDKLGTRPILVEGNRASRLLWDKDGDSAVARQRHDELVLELGREGLLREVLKAADTLQAEGLLKHCLEAFRGGLTVHTAMEHLVWAHKHGPEEARKIAMTYVVQHYKAIQVTVPKLTN
jgi:hypothetical protein